MSKKFNNKILFGVLLLLAGIFFATNFLRDKSRNKHSLPDKVIAIDSVGVEAISLFPKSTQGQEIRFSKNGGLWQVESNGITAEADQLAVQRIVDALQGLKPQRLAAKNKDQWSKYEVTDSLGTRVTITTTGNKKPQDIYIGKFTYKQQPGGNQFGGNQGITGTTYVRRGGDKKVYATEGFLAMTFNQNFNAWRKSDFLKAEKQAIQSIQFDYPENNNFALTKVDSVWTMGGKTANAEAVEKYLNLFTNRAERNFADGFTPAGPPQRTITVAGEAMSAVVIQCWSDAEGAYYLHSSLNSNAYFKSDGEGIYKELFVGKEELL